MRQIIILGGGTAGSILANRLSRELPTKEYQITVVDRNNLHHYQPGYLFVPFGMYRPRSVVKPRSRFLPAGVQFVPDTILRVDPETKTVELATQKLQYDYLIITTGCTIRPDQVPGMSDPRVWRRSVFDFYTLSGATKLHRALRDFPGGKLVVHTSEVPIKCPVAPLEFTFLADWFFFRRRRRFDVDITFVTPLDGAFTKPVAKQELGDMLRKRGIEVETDFNVERIDADAKLLVGYDGREIPFDLLVTVPPMMGQQYVIDSGLGDEMGFIPVDPHTLQSQEHPDIFVLGDASNVPTSKAGSVAHFQSESFVENFLQFLRGQAMTHSFDGHANCFIESGYGKAMLLDFNYQVQPFTGRFPLPGIGPLRLLGESRMNHLSKLAFYFLYWHFLVRGRPLPFPRDMPLAGKEFRRWGFEEDGVTPRPQVSARVEPHPEVVLPKVRLRSTPPSRIEESVGSGVGKFSSQVKDAIPVLSEAAGVRLELSEEGYLTNPEQWSPEVGRALAEALGLALDEGAWKVIEFVRADFEKRGVSPTLGRIAKVGGFDVKSIFAAFGNKPAKKLAYIAGAPKPVGCV